LDSFKDWIPAPRARAWDLRWRDVSYNCMGGNFGRNQMDLDPVLRSSLLWLTRSAAMAEVSSYGKRRATRYTSGGRRPCAC
jgi:hypothetical protein